MKLKSKTTAVDSCFFILSKTLYNSYVGSTKIINILKNDPFEDIFEEFKKAEAEEVIFILPKNSKIARNESHFVSLAGEAQSSQKKLTIMTADESVKSHAQKYGFKLLDDPSDKDDDREDKKEKVDDDLLQDIAPELPEAEEIEHQENAGIIEKDDSEEEDYHPDADTGEYPSEDLIEEKEDESLADLAVAKMSDIRKPSKESQIKIRGGGEKSSSLKVKKDLSSEKSLRDLENSWLSSEREGKRSRTGKSFWDNINIIKKDKVPHKINLILAAAGVILLGTILYLFLGSAQILIKPQKQKLDFELSVSVSSAYSQADSAANKIPGQFLSFTADLDKDFASSGQKEVAQKARGEITVYNNFNSEPQNLVATTRFESSSGLVFRTPRPVSIPGAKLISGKLVPGSITVEVIADKPGKDYNINADKFTIPGFKGTPKYTGFYGESSKPMAGGMTGLSKVVTERDFNSAKDAVTKEVLAKAAENLKLKTNGLKILEPTSNEIVSLKSTAEVDDAAEGFAISATAEARTVGFHEDDLFALVENFVNKKGNLEVLKNSLNLNYGNIQLDAAKKTLSFKLGVSGEAAARVNQEKLVNGLLGMPQSKIKDYLLAIPEVESARVILSPFWVRTVPKNKNDIETKIIY